MTLSLVLLAGLVGIAQILLIVTLRQWKRLSSPGSAVVVLIALGAVLSLHVVVGVYAQGRWNLITRAAHLIEGEPTRPSFATSTTGDTGLLGLAVLGSQALPRPDFSLAGLASWQEAVRAAVKNKLLLPTTPSSDAQPAWRLLGTESLANGVERHAIAIRAFDRTMLPAYVFVPRTAHPSAAVLVLPGHAEIDAQSGLAQTAGLVDSYQHGAALELAQRGFVTLTFELRGFGLLGPPSFPNHLAVARNAILAGLSYKAVIFEDVRAAMEVLRARPEVDADLIGVAGASFGGEMAGFYAAVDTRVRAVAINSFAPAPGPYAPATGENGEERKRHLCHLVPGENKVLLQEDWLFLVAPRPLLIVHGDAEPFGDLTLLSAAYDALKMSERFALKAVPGRGHEFFVDETAEFFRRHLRR